MRLCIDLMGSDTSPHFLFPAVIEAARHLTPSDVLVCLVTPVVQQDLEKKFFSVLNRSKHCRIEFHEVSQVIRMDEDPIRGIRRKKQSSIVEGISLLKQHQIDALISCGNTGALIAGAYLLLPPFNGVSRPGLLVSFPTQRGYVSILDVGGNVSCTAEHLVGFALLGAAHDRILHGNRIPKVGLLNIGVEAMKGTIAVREAYDALMAYCQQAKEEGFDLGMQFMGNVEARDVFRGVVDVVVTDGFTGNILLKTAEGISTLMLDSLGQSLDADAFSECCQRFNYTEYPGAIVCGASGLVVKVHGNASSDSLLASILSAAQHVENGYAAKMQDAINRIQ